MVQKDRLIVVCGPTASGKSALAVEIAEKFDGEIISADSVSVYRGLDIGSAKPTEEERKRAVHRLIDVASPFEEFSVSEYEKLALPVVYDAIKRGKIPVVCGGTGFYINSILYKMSYGNSKGDREIREKYAELVEKRGKSYIFGLLKKVDPETAAKLHENDVVRVVRALEIFESTGVKKSDIKDEKIQRFDPFVILTEMPREKLYARINARVDEMIKRGLEREVKGLLSEGVCLENQCMQGIGYKEIAESGKADEETVEKIKMNSRRYAKRQITFFKRYENARAIDTENLADKEKLFEEIKNFLK
ncbi:MAG TPA: tRNA (adenosine(37)-N6)-dimethylallyltransferase MiaA [Clostridiales bacterium]|nr:tRNA (adenosine(37)-N6)-dimethylallyltransferase MiaA [Clostridiales bacterium]